MDRHHPECCVWVWLLVSDSVVPILIVMSVLVCGQYLGGPVRHGVLPAR